MLLPNQFSSETRSATDTSAITALCKAAGDPLRMQILKVLQQNAYGVLEMCQVFDIRQPAMSHHLKILANAGLVATRREGTTIFYRRNEMHPDTDLQALQYSLFHAIDEAALDPNLRNRLAEINGTRAAASVAFFNQNAVHFEENQDLIASWSDYGDSVESFLPDNTTGNQSALEIGPGYGQFLSRLSAGFDRVTALDNSAEMLEQCRSRSAAQSLTNVSFMLGDTDSAISYGVKADFISLNMVLHHNPTPAEIIADCAQLLNKNGTLLITELCAHDQEWVKEVCGDLWLGFEPKALSQWCFAANLAEGNSQYLTQRNGFRIQLRQFNLDAN
ncbi:MAG TPA: metalloregulator ArsR/SmtB family transcription factor [Porticoccaceae bacterium]|nr:metalloregulator ArsR/SmtB family transcription factor [Porticoccaceae bacterium]HIK80263.1 metalloregulator ArsR/SmtB family transcription factor [Porticoccaceae bacterium]